MEQFVINYIIIGKYKDWYTREFQDDSWRLEFMSYIEDRALERWTHLRKNRSSLKEYKMFKHKEALDDDADDIPWEEIGC